MEERLYAFLSDKPEELARVLETSYGVATVGPDNFVYAIMSKDELTAVMRRRDLVSGVLFLKLL